MKATEIYVGSPEHIDDAGLMRMQLDCIECRIAIEEHRAQTRRRRQLWNGMVGGDRGGDGARGT